MKKNKIKIGLGLAIALIVMSGCTTVPAVTYEEKKSIADSYELPIAASENETQVYVLRPQEVIGGAVRFKVYLDGKKEDGKYIGYTRGKQYLAFLVEPGVHTIYSKAENWSSTGFDAISGQVIFLRQTVQVGLLFARNSIEKIDEVDGKYLMSVVEMKEGAYISEE